MIRYDLKCKNDHSFESWFQSARAFDRLKAAGMITCVECGSTDVSKCLMTPNVRAGRNGKSVRKDTKPAGNDKKALLTRLKAEIEANSEYVGTNFATEARAIHDGDAPERSIHGEARPGDAKALIEDGLPILPLPFVSSRKAN